VVRPTLYRPDVAAPIWLEYFTLLSALP
jgi:hypothetical protein